MTDLNSRAKSSCAHHLAELFRPLVQYPAQGNVSVALDGNRVITPIVIGYLKLNKLGE